MITGFEIETAPLNDIEMDAAGLIAHYMQQGHIGIERAVTGQTIAEGMARNYAKFRDTKGRPYLTGARIRKIMNYIRMYKYPFILASSKGYYISTDKSEIEEYAASLRARAKAIEAVANRLQTALL